mgnify:CR=1 FL=1
MNDLRNDQSSDGRVPHVIPDCLFNGGEPSALWTDVVCFLPWTLYEMYGDETFLEDNLNAMKLYLGALENRMEDGLLIKYVRISSIETENVCPKNDEIQKAELKSQTELDKAEKEYLEIKEKN